MQEEARGEIRDGQKNGCDGTGNYVAKTLITTI